MLSSTSTFQLSVAVFCFLNVKLVDGFACNPVSNAAVGAGTLAWRQPASFNMKSQHTSITALATSGKSNDDGEVGEGDNWIEKSFPVATEEGVDIKKVEDYNLGISGEAFQTGPLGKRMFEAIVSRTSLDISDEILQALTLYAMDFTAKEAARAALKQNGLQMVLQEEEEDQGLWGDVEAIRLYDANTGIKFNKFYDSLEDAVKSWVPGQTFDFVVRQVPAKVRELSVEELLQALDPNGKLREEARAAKGSLSDEEALAAIFDDDEIKTLSDLATINVKRTNDAPRGASVEGEAYAGLDKTGYRVIKRSDLMQDSINADGTENEKTTMQVMNALVSHGVLLVDLTDGGASFKTAKVMANMWKTADSFFDKLEDEQTREKLPGMTTVMETGSQHAKVGYACYENGSTKFLETRIQRKTGALLPAEATGILGEDGVSSLKKAFDIVAEVGKDVVRITTAASNIEHGAFSQQTKNERDRKIQASQAATLMTNELVDDGKPLDDTVKIEHNEGSVSMSPHRLCSYSNKKEGDNGPAREVFGAHVDASFITAVPVAAVSGLEVYDEEAEKWYRPELKARKHWEQEQSARDKDPTALVEDVDGEEVPWHARYICIMAGEILQVATRDEVSACVHRVVAAKDSPARLSAPILLRPRPGTKFLADRYLGGSLGNPLIEECDGMTMEEIFNATQPSSFQ